MAEPAATADIARRATRPGVEQRLTRLLNEGWDSQRELDAVLRSQAMRRVVKEAMQSSPRFPNWSYVVRQGDDTRFVRGSGFQSGTTATKAKARYPRLLPAS